MTLNRRRFLALALAAWILGCRAWGLEEGPAAQAVTDTTGDPTLDGTIYPTPFSAQMGSHAWKVEKPVLVSDGKIDPRVAKAVTEWLHLAEPPMVVGALPEVGTAVLVGGPSRNGVARQWVDKAKLTFEPEAWGRHPDQSYLFKTAREGNLLVVLLAGLEAAGDYYAVQTARQVSRHHDDGAVWVREAEVRDGPAFKLRGIKGLSAEYASLYAPLKLNFGWTYTGTVQGDSSSAQKKATAIKAYTDCFGETAVSFNPGTALSKGVGGDSAAETLKNNITSTFAFWADAGARHFVLSFDDQPTGLHSSYAKVYDSYWKAHADMLKTFREAVRAKAPQAPVYWCPHEYHGTNIRDEPNVVSAREAGLPEDLLLCWTGHGVTSHGMNLAKAKAYGDSFGRRPALFYYNWPIGVPSTCAETGPQPPAEANLAEITDIHMMCSNHDRASYVAFLSGLDWAWNPKAYSPELSNKLAAREWARRFGGKAAYAPLLACMEWKRTHNSRTIVPDQAQRTPDELSKLVDDEEAFFAKQVPLLKAHLTDQKLASEIEKTASARIATFRKIVENQRHMRKGKAARLDGTIVLDGKLDEAAWEKAPALDGFITKGSFTEKTTPATVARVLYDDQFLYVGLRLDEPKIKEVKPYTEKTGWKVQHGDFIQLSIDHTGEKSRAGFLCTTTHGQASSYDFGHKHLQNFEVKVATYPDHWVAEFKLPLQSLDAQYKPAPGRTWGFNVIRNRVVKSEKGMELSSWSPLASTKDLFKGEYCGDLTFE
ncbi:MAG: hypothetical protein AMXMBFR7_45980 [Planctomycetota bacterium]